MVNINSYYSLKTTGDDIEMNVHRDAVGGLWEELCELTFEFLVNKANIKPDMKILDLGSGCFRCAIKIIEYLNPANYYAIDLNEDLINAGFIELKKYGIENKVPQKNVHITEDFDAEVFKVKFDIVLAQSLWTHLPLNHIQRSLAAVENVLSPEGSFYATFFLCPEDYDLLKPHRQEPGGIITHRDKDPYHYRIDDFIHVIKQIRLPLEIIFIGDWNHHRNQYMICFKRTKK